LKKKKYTAPEVSRINLDYSFSLLMASQPGNPTPRGGGGGGGGQDEPFASPFDNNKPFD